MKQKNHARLPQEPVVRPGRMTKSGPTGGQRHAVAIAAVCAIFLIIIIGANASHGNISASNSPAVEAVQISLWKRIIRRLKPADPEGTEIMLATGSSQAVSYPATPA